MIRLAVSMGGSIFLVLISHQPPQMPGFIQTVDSKHAYAHVCAVTYLNIISFYDIIIHNRNMSCLSFGNMSIHKSKFNNKNSCSMSH